MKFTHIILQNFQTIGARTTIPIERLTLLFGPNSAGKSAIFDALEVLQAFGAADGKRVWALLQKHGRYVNGEFSGLTEIGLVIEAHQEFEFEIFQEDFLPISPANFVEYCQTYSDDFRQELAAGPIEVSFCFDLKNKTPHSIKICFNNNPVIEFEWRDGAGMFALINLRSWIDGESKVTSSHWANVKDRQVEIGPIKRWFASMAYHNEWFEVEEVGAPANQLMASVLLLAQLIVRHAVKTSLRANQSALPLVSASRHVPTSDQCVIAVGGNFRPTDSGIIHGQRLSPEALDVIFSTIATKFSAADPHLFYLATAFSDQQIAGEDGMWWEKNFVDRINSMLREELFKEKGYQLCARSVLFVEQDDAEDGFISYPETNARLVHLFLRDAHGDEVEIEAVGSGIGYALPVLVALCHPGRAWVQQPELHLHPALQGGMGEAIVKAIENKQHFDSNVIIETHSENLLLRILRLVKSRRFESDGDIISRLNFEDISLLYFDPQPDGCSKVKRIRIAPDGSFVDNWPRGFFLERLDDLLGL